MSLIVPAIAHGLVFAGAKKLVQMARRRMTRPKRISGTRTRTLRQAVSAARSRGTTVRSARASIANTRTSGFIGLENKFLDSELNATAVSTTWTAHNPTAASVNCLSAPAAGDGESDRDGRVYHINSIHMHGQVLFNATESQTAPIDEEFVRIALVWDTQTNKSEVVGTDVMDGGGSNDNLAFRNLQNSKRFIVLKDFTVKVVPESMNEGAANLFASRNFESRWSINKIFRTPIKVNTAGTAANVNVVTDNSLSLIVQGTNTAIAVGYQCRVRFSG